MRQVLLLLLFLSTLLINTISMGVSAQEMPPAQVKVAMVEKRIINPTIMVSGSVISTQDSTLTVEVSGELMSIVEPGVLTKKGTPLAQIDHALYELNVESAKARIGQLTAELTFQEKNLKRISSLAKRDSASESQYQQAMANRDSLKFQIDDAETTLALAERQLGKTTIVAPFPGIVVSRTANIGEFINSGNELLRIVNPDAAEISIFAPLSSLALLKTGQNVLVLADDKEFISTIKTIVPVGDLRSRMVEIRVHQVSPALTIGTSVKVKLPTNTQNETLTIPRDALIIKSSGYLIYKVNNGAAELANASVLAFDESYVAVKGDIKEGDQVIIRGGERLQPGQSVVVIE